MPAEKRQASRQLEAKQGPNRGDSTLCTCTNRTSIALGGKEAVAKGQRPEVDKAEKARKRERIGHGGGY